MADKTIKDFTEGRTFIASDEDDRLNFLQRKMEASDFGGFSLIAFGDDWFVYENKGYYLILDCGQQTLYKKRFDEVTF